ncbi:MAG: hypothetical protein SVZ03_05205 [Spirochaetota bacterium]|nr:hypothetical protein [Spirochaetota bacterium]
MRKYINLICCLMLFIGGITQGLNAQLEEGQRFFISGFMSMRYMQTEFDSLHNSSAAGYSPNINENVSFWQSNLNLYFTFKPTRDWFAFSEIRFNYAPTGDYQLMPYDMDGDGNNDTYSFINSLTGQTEPLPLIYALPNNTTHVDRYFFMFDYGSIYIERAYIEWERLAYAKLRAGKYITPFGIFSQDHGEPATTSIRLPLVVSTSQPYYGMPLTQTGVELYGEYGIPLDILFEYAAYVGNGISTGDAESDSFDKNKSIGGFMNFILHPIADNIYIEFGGSVYYGERSLLLYKVYKTVPGIAPNEATDDPTDIATYVNFSSDSSLDRYTARQMETSGLAHLKITIRSLPLDGTFVLQAEGIYQKIEMNNDPRIVDPFSKQQLIIEDYYYYAYYIQGEYQFFGKITPYFRYEYSDRDVKDPLKLIWGKIIYLYVLGLNYKPDPVVSIKAEWNHIKSNTPLSYFNNDFDVYTASVSLAF